MGQYSTEQRKKLFNFFKENLHESFSAKQIHEKINDESISISAIYRNLALMEEEGILCKMTNSGSRGLLYQYIDPESCAGIVHLICDKCSVTFHLNKHISDLITNISMESFGFKVNSQKAIIYGLCENCSQIYQ